MRHPEKGDAARAVLAMNRRVAAGTELEGDVCEPVGDLHIDATTGRVTGDGLGVYRPVYGDLFEIGETLLASMMVTDLFERIAVEQPEEIKHILVSLYLQAVGTGVLMERARWERDA